MDLISIELLKPYERNNRKHNSRQVELIANSIKEFGFNQPIVVDENNEILVGHGRFEAAQKLALKEVPVVQLKTLTQKQKRAYRILDNKLQNDSRWDFENLASELEWLRDNDLEFDSWDLENLANIIGSPVTTSAEDEWTAMPDYESKDSEALQTIKVHFMSHHDVQAFAALIGQPLTEKTKSIWYPAQVARDLKKIRVIEEHEDDEDDE